MANGWGPGQLGSKFCGKCQKPLTYVQQYNQWYCYSCGTYEQNQASQSGEDVQPQRTESRCQTCGETLFYIKRYDQNFCYKCNAYSPPTPPAPTPVPVTTVAPAQAVEPVTIPKSEPSPTIPVISEAKPKCPECDMEVEPGWIRCPGCGNALETSDIPERPVVSHDEKPKDFHSMKSELGKKEAEIAGLPHSMPKTEVSEPWEARHGGEYSWEPQALREEESWSGASQRDRIGWQEKSAEERKVRDQTAEELRAKREAAAKQESMAYRRASRAEADSRSARADSVQTQREEDTKAERRMWDEANAPVKSEPKPSGGEVPDGHQVKLDSESEFLVELFENLFSSFLKEPMEPISFYRSKVRVLSEKCETISKFNVNDDGKVQIFIRVLDFNRILANLTGMLDSIIETEAKISSRAQAMARAKEALEPIVRDYQEEIDDLGISSKLLSRAFAARLPSGVAGLDEMLHGGIPNGASIILQGPTSGEKDILANQFLGCGLNENGSIMIVVTMISPDEWRTQMRGLGHRLSDFEKEGQISIVDWYTHKNERVRSVEVRGAVILSSKSITNLEIAIDKAIKSIKDAPTKRAVITILSPAIKALGFDTVYGFAQSIRGKFKKYNITGLFLLDKGMHDQNVVTSLQSVFDGVFDIERERVGDSMVTRFGILSLKGMTFESKYMELDLTKQGLSVKGIGAPNGTKGPAFK